MQVPGNASPASDGAPRVRLARGRRSRAADPVDDARPDDRVRVDASRAGLVAAVDGSPSTGSTADGCRGLDARLDSLRPARQRRARRSGRSTTAPAPSRRTATARRTRSPLEVGLSEPADWTLRIRDDDGHDAEDLTRASRRHRRRDAGRRRRAASTTAATAGRSTRPTAGATARSRTTARFTVDTTAPDAVARGRRRRDPAVQPQRRRLPATPSRSPRRRPSRAPSTGTVRNAADEVVDAGRPRA